MRMRVDNGPRLGRGTVTGRTFGPDGRNSTEDNAATSVWEAIASSLGLSFRSSDYDPIRDLLEDFDTVGAVGDLALVSRRKFTTDFVEGVNVVAHAASHGLSSLDYARRRYRSKQDRRRETSADRLRDEYVSAFRSAKTYLARLREKFDAEGRECTAGVFGAALVLARTAMSFFCAHLLYRLGHRYEGHAVARLILEQVAWAYAACRHDDLQVIANLSPTRSISVLKEVAPDAGPLYGFLSSKTHIDYASHMEFLKSDKGTNVVLLVQLEFVEYGEIVLRLADLFGIVYEASQYEFIRKPETVRMTKKHGLQVLPSRPFARTMAKHRRAFAALAATPRT